MLGCAGSTLRRQTKLSLHRYPVEACSAAPGICRGVSAAEQSTPGHSMGSGTKLSELK